MDAQLQLGFQAANTQLHALRTLVNGDNADNTALLTTAQGDLVAAINEVFGIANSSVGSIENDFAVMTSTSVGLSKAAVAGYVAQEGIALRDGLINGAPAEFDTMIELLTEIQANDGDISGAVSDIAANTTLANTAQTTADGAVADAATADAKAVTATTNAAAADTKAVAAQASATSALANAATADTKAVAAQASATTATTNAATADAKAVTAQNDLAAFELAVGPLTTDYAAIVANGL